MIVCKDTRPSDKSATGTDPINLDVLRSLNKRSRWQFEQPPVKKICNIQALPTTNEPIRRPLPLISFNPAAGTIACGLIRGWEMEKKEIRGRAPGKSS